jgi:hypothetical protein
MNLLTFKEWLAMKESSALTRSRREAAFGLKPPMADYMSHSTPTPFEMKSLKKKLKKKRKKK